MKLRVTHGDLGSVPLRVCFRRPYASIWSGLYFGLEQHGLVRRVRVGVRDCYIISPNEPYNTCQYIFNDSVIVPHAALHIVK
jgi:hypothetical protein